MSYSTIKSWFDVNILTNGVGSITGAKHNTASVTYGLNVIPSLIYDISRPYTIGQFCFYISANKYGLYTSIAGSTAGAFNRSEWTCLFEAETVTSNITGSGSQVINHNLGVLPKIIHGEYSDGSIFELNVTARSTTTITINHTTARTGVKIHLTTWGL